MMVRRGSETPSLKLQTPNKFQAPNSNRLCSLKLSIYLARIWPLNVASIFVLMELSQNVTTRREFLRTSALVGSALVAPAILSGKLYAKENSETLRIGLIGCGGRGSGAANQALS